MSDVRAPGCLVVILLIVIGAFGYNQFNRFRSDWKALAVRAQTAEADARRAHQRLGALEARLSRLEAAPKPTATAEPAR